MKENSIEEDIKILEKKIEDYKPYKNIEYCSHAGQILQEEHKALEHILSDYKRVLKENEYMHNELDKQQTTINKYAKENELAKQEYDRDTHILQNQLNLANADRIELAQQNKELRKEKETLLNICSKQGGVLIERK